MSPAAPNSQAIRERLAELIKANALRFGDFTLASGQKSTYFIDGKQVTLEAEGAWCIGQLMLAEVVAAGAEAAGGMTLGADPIVGATLAAAGQAGVPLKGFVVRKERKDHGMGDQVAGPLPKGATVVMLEDVVTTGGMTLKAIEAVERECEAKIVRVVAVVDRLQGARQNIEAAGYQFAALFTIEELGVKPAEG